MIPTPIPDNEIWDGAVRRVIGPPSGDPTDTTCRSVEALIDSSTMGPRFNMRCELEPGDLAALASGGCVWVSIVGDHLHPFVVDVLPTHKQTASLVVTCDDDANWAAQINGIPDGMDPKTFVRGCIQALQEMLQKPLHEG